MSDQIRPNAEATLHAIFAVIRDSMEPGSQRNKPDVIIRIADLLKQHGMQFAADDEMSEQLTDDQIALLCRIGESDLAAVTEDKKRDLEWLVSGGYAEPAVGDPGSAFRLTAKAHEFLEKRGVGLNEA